MPFLPRQCPNVGLDVGSAFVRAVALRRTRDGWSLVAAGQAQLDVSGDAGADVRATVRRLLDDLKLRRINVAVAVPAGAAIVRRLSLPGGSVSDLTRQVGLEAEQHMPFAPHEVSVSYQVLNRRKAAPRSTDLGTVDVLLGAARRNEVAERASLVSGRRRRAAVADVEGLALANAFILNYPDHADFALLLHISHRSTVICLVERGELIATRGVELGAPVPGGDRAKDVRELVAAIRQVVASENPARLFLSGGAWQAEGLSSRLGDEFGAPVEAFDPRRRIRMTTASRGVDLVGPPFAVAVGLALRGKGNA